jgi:hypothetical protein
MLRWKRAIGCLDGRRASRAVRSIAGLLVALGVGAPARAIPIVEIVFVSTTGAGGVGGSTIVATPGDVLLAELRLHAGPEGVSSYGLSLQFDDDLKDEVDVLAAQERTPAGFAFSFSPGVVAGIEESHSARAGRVLTFEAETLGLGPADATFTIGTLELRVGAHVATDGLDIVTGLWNPGVDGLFDNAGVSLAGVAQWGGAAIDAVPEPSSVLLISCGLAALAASGSAGRRIRARRGPQRKVSRFTATSKRRALCASPRPAVLLRPSQSQVRPSLLLAYWNLRLSVAPMRGTSSSSITSVSSSGIGWRGSRRSIQPRG